MLFLRPGRPNKLAAPLHRVSSLVTILSRMNPFHIFFSWLLHTTRSVSCLHPNTVCWVYYIATYKTSYLRNCKFLAVVALKSQCRENEMLCVTFIVCIPFCCMMKKLPCTAVFYYYYYYYYVTIINKIKIIDGLHWNSLRAGRSGDRIPVGARFPVPVQTGPGDHPASYTLGTGTFSGVKRPWHGIDHPLLSSAEVKERVELQLQFPPGLCGMF